LTGINWFILINDLEDRLIFGIIFMSEIQRNKIPNWDTFGMGLPFNASKAFFRRFVLNDFILIFGQKFSPVLKLLIGGIDLPRLGILNNFLIIIRCSCVIATT